MEDEGIHNRIEQLVAKSRSFYERGAEGGLTEIERRTLDSIKVGLDQCWDLLRQRRALREAGGDPSVAHVRERTVTRAVEGRSSGRGFISSCVRADPSPTARSRSRSKKRASRRSHSRSASNRSRKAL